MQKKNSPGPRIRREQKTVAAMIRLYCQYHHNTTEKLCPDCQHLLDYALLRLERCPFQEGKTTCARCLVHCYKTEERALIRAVMRFSGPRMIHRHPWLALRHIFDGFRRHPIRPLSAKKQRS